MKILVNNVNISYGDSSEWGSTSMFHVEWLRKMNIPVPKLIEVNFMGDLHAFELAMQYLPLHDHTRGITAFHKWAAELIHCIISTEQNPTGFIQLTDHFTH